MGQLAALRNEDSLAGFIFIYAFQMKKFAETCERIAATTKKLEKTAIVAEYMKSRPTPEAAIGAVFLSGRPFPVWEETTLQVGDGCCGDWSPSLPEKTAVN